MYSYLFRLQMSESDFAIVEKLVADCHPKTAFKKRVRLKILRWAFKHKNGQEFLNKREWEYLRLMHKPVENPIKEAMKNVE